MRARAVAAADAINSALRDLDPKASSTEVANAAADAAEAAYDKVGLPHLPMGGHCMLYRKPCRRESGGPNGSKETCSFMAYGALHKQQCRLVLAD
jgi:hypothetical protein